MAITSSGDVVVGLGYCSSAKNLRELLNVVSTMKLKRGQRFYLGVVLDDGGRNEVLHRLDHGAAEAAALSGVGDPKRRGRRA